MMKYTTCSMLAVGAIAVMQGESVTQTDALQIKKLQGRGVEQQQEGARRDAAANGGGVMKPVHRNKHKASIVAGNVSATRGYGSRHGLTYHGPVPDELVSAASSTEVAHENSSSQSNVEVESAAPTTPKRAVSHAVPASSVREPHPQEEKYDNREARFAHRSGDSQIVRFAFPTLTTSAGDGEEDNVDDGEISELGLGQSRASAGLLRRRDGLFA